MRKIPRLCNQLDSGAVVANDIIVISISVLLMSLLTILLGSCAKVGQFGADDAQKATVIATAVGDSAAAACWQVIEAIGKAISEAGDKPGLLVGIEEKRAVETTLQSAACQPVWAEAFTDLLKSTLVARAIP